MTMKKKEDLEFEMYVLKQKIEDTKNEDELVNLKKELKRLKNNYRRIKNEQV